MFFPSITSDTYYRKTTIYIDKMATKVQTLDFQFFNGLVKMLSFKFNINLRDPIFSSLQWAFLERNMVFLTNPTYNLTLDPFCLFQGSKHLNNQILIFGKVIRCSAWYTSNKTCLNPSIQSQSFSFIWQVQWENQIIHPWNSNLFLSQLYYYMFPRNNIYKLIKLFLLLVKLIMSRLD